MAQGPRRTPKDVRISSSRPAAALLDLPLLQDWRCDAAVLATLLDSLASNCCLLQL